MIGHTWASPSIINENRFTLCSCLRYTPMAILLSCAVTADRLFRPQYTEWSLLYCQVRRHSYNLGPDHIFLYQSHIRTRSKHHAILTQKAEDLRLEYDYTYYQQDRFDIPNDTYHTIPEDHHGVDRKRSSMCIHFGLLCTS